MVVNRLYQFDTIAPNTLGARHKDKKLVGIYNIDMANREQSMYDLGQRVKLESNLDFDETGGDIDDVFYKFIDKYTKEIMFLSKKWIHESTIEEMQYA